MADSDLDTDLQWEEWGQRDPYFAAHSWTATAFRWPPALASGVPALYGEIPAFREVGGDVP